MAYTAYWILMQAKFSEARQQIRFPSVVKPWRRVCLRRQNGPMVLVASSSQSDQNWTRFPGSVVLIKAEFIFTSPTFARMD